MLPWFRRGAAHPQWRTPPPMTIQADCRYSATLHTNKGVLKVQLFADEAPHTVNNFVFLARQGFYNDVPFHRVIRGFMVQTGDPTGTGAGGPGYHFADEPVCREYQRGTVAMANAGPDTNGSQFFICHQAVRLPPRYTIFGQVTEGLDVLDAIASVPVGVSRTGEQSVPQEEVHIERVEIEEAA
ncbi:MAG: peptidylprolyl isomerase [Armatimonadetes bacterium]|nr:peptidylprolyl isomerase [Armatimonadota bacterium]